MSGPTLLFLADLDKVASPLTMPLSPAPAALFVQCLLTCSFSAPLVSAPIDFATLQALAKAQKQPFVALALIFAPSPDPSVIAVPALLDVPVSLPSKWFSFFPG